MRSLLALVSAEAVSTSTFEPFYCVLYPNIYVYVTLCYFDFLHTHICNLKRSYPEKIQRETYTLMRTS